MGRDHADEPTSYRILASSNRIWFLEAELASAGVGHLQRRFAIVSLVTLTAWLGLAAVASAREAVQSISVAYHDIGIQVDGQTVKTDSEPFVVVSEGRTYVPARALAEALGAKVSWDASSNTVLVYTPRYVQTSTSGSLATYTLPYWGLSVQLPPGGALDASATTQHLLLAVKVGDAAVMLAHLSADPSLTIDAEAAAFVKGMQVIVPDLALSNQRSIPMTGASGAIEATSRGTGDGIPIDFRFRLIAAGRDLWVVAIMYPDASAAQDASIVDQAFSSFQFPTGTGT